MLASVESGSRTLGECLRQYFEENGFGEDGGYSAAWVDFHLGKIPFPFPNTAGRKLAVPFHDLHHIVTGYRTDVAGEFEIGAWEVASGCRSFIAAWQINLAGLGAGLIWQPKRTLRAFVRGRRSRNLYGRTYDAALLSTPVADARRSLGLDAPVSKATAFDIVLFLAASLAGLASALLFSAICTPLAVVAWPILQISRRAHERRATSGARTSGARTSGARTSGAPAWLR